YQDVTRWLAEVVESQRKQKELDLALRISPDLPKLSYDQEKMRRVMVNLLQNATEAINDRVEENERRGASYTPAIAIDARLKGDCVVIEIQDNGIGMDPNTLAHAFEPLFTTRSQKTGMGLAIVKKIVEEHDGSIILESRRGIGTRAQLTLPLKESRLEH
ncbi:MAG: ATP-binding protein, partial [Desulfobacteraceae bacterium]|nr:ATP-binding protein [Desulfobacteraceae bacterium]